MKSLMGVVFVVFAFVLPLHPAQAQAQQHGTSCSSSIAAVVVDAVKEFRSKTSVPIRLPTCVTGLDSTDKVHAIVRSADERTYVIVLGATPDCEGQHVCSYGTMIGTSLPLNQIDEYDVSRRPRSLVNLHHGIKGYFYAPVCGAYCSDSFITWTEGAYHYIIGSKAEKRRNLIASVNSAIDSSEVQQN